MPPFPLAYGETAIRVVLAETPRSPAAVVAILVFLIALFLLCGLALLRLHARLNEHSQLLRALLNLAHGAGDLGTHLVNPGGWFAYRTWACCRCGAQFRGQTGYCPVCHAGPAASE